jgi:hypothetical protein
MPLPEPLLIRDEDEFIYTWPHPGDLADSLGSLSIAIDKVRDTSGDTYGEVHAEYSGTFGTGRIFAHRKVNLVGATTVGTLVKIFSDKLNGSSQADLFKPIVSQVFEQVVDRTLTEWRKGEALIEMADVGYVGEVKYAIDPFLPADDNAYIFGQGAAKKGWLAISMALHWAAGKDMPNGIKVNTTGRPNVLYLDWEASANETARRLQWMARGMGIAVPRGIRYKRMGGPIITHIDELRRQVKTEDIGLVIVDSMGPAAGGDLNKTDIAIPASNAIRRLSPANRLIIAHITKGERGGDSKDASIIGSVFFDNLARSTWKISTEEIGEDEYNLGCFHVKVNTGRNRGNLAFNLKFFDNTKTVSLMSADVRDNPAAFSELGGSVRDRMMLALRNGAKTRKELTDMLDCKSDTLDKTIKRELRRSQPDIVINDDKTIGRIARNEDIPF